MTPTTSICVHYKSADGWHIFSSDDLPGLYVASTAAKTAYDDVGPSIEMLLRLNENIRCSALPEMTFDEFIDSVRDSTTTDKAGDRFVLSNKRFLLSAAQ